MGLPVFHRRRPVDKPEAHKMHSRLLGQKGRASPYRVQAEVRNKLRPVLMECLAKLQKAVLFNYS